MIGPDAAAKLGHLCRISAAHARLRHLVHLAGGGRLADESNTRILLDYPGATPRARGRACNTVLSIPTCCRSSYCSCLVRATAVVAAASAERDLGVSLALYALVHVSAEPSTWPNSVWSFNPLAWQLLIVLGVWWIIEDEEDCGRG